MNGVLIMTRREARIQAMQILYTNGFYNSSLLESLNYHEADEKEVIKSFIDLVVGNEEKIDNIISECLVNYTIERLNQVDKAIIRLATAELLAGTARNIVINEALEITKEYSDQGDGKAVKFNNKLLDNIANRINQ
jgi:N utilization substance protein B